MFCCPTARGVQFRPLIDCMGGTFPATAWFQESDSFQKAMKMVLRYILSVISFSHRIQTSLTRRTWGVNCSSVFPQVEGVKLWPWNQGFHFKLSCRFYIKFRKSVLWETISGTGCKSHHQVLLFPIAYRGLFHVSHITLNGVTCVSMCHRCWENNW